MILPDKEQFPFKECEIAGDKCWLITPNHIGVKWVEENKWFRSIIIRQEDHHIVSVGFPKFTNYFEQPDFCPWNESWPIDARHKKDGSLILVSWYKGQLIVRTRGVVDVMSQETGKEVYDLVRSSPDLITTVQYGDMTFLFEHTGPSRIIVLSEDKQPTLTLLGAVNHNTLQLESQEWLDFIGQEWGFPRPQKYTYNSIKECLEDVAAWKGKEGVVLYSPDGQTLKKIKSEEYLSLHRLATGLTSFEHVVDVFLAGPNPRFEEKKEFFEYVEKTLSWEIAIKLDDHIGRVIDCYNHFQTRRKDILQYFIQNGVLNYKSRKEQATEVFNVTKNIWERTIGFLLLDSAHVEDKLLKKILVTINETLNV